jgi:1-deoxy-D-xylulose-5-phosphate synthase
LQRAYDQIIHDVCIQNLPVIFAIDRAGIVGEDGPTHQGLFDLSFLRSIPNLMVMAPADLSELRTMLMVALKHDGPSAIRYPRGKSSIELRLSRDVEIVPGRAEVLLDGEDITIVGIGAAVYPAFKAAEMLKKDGIHACVVNARFIKPIDKDLIVSLSQRSKKLIVVEENVLAGGFGSSVLECLSNAGITDVAVKRIGIDDEFVEHGSQRRLREKYDLDDQGIYRIALQFVRGR